MFDNLAFCGNGISLRISLIITLKDTRLELLTLLRQKVKHKKLTFVEYEKTKNTLRQGI